MTPLKCARHEMRFGELADSERYTKALRDSQRCWRCRVLAVLARFAWKLSHERQAGPISMCSVCHPTKFFPNPEVLDQHVHEIHGL
jgi:hypothetical protein